MSRLELRSPNQAQLVVEGLYKDLERRIESSPPGLCPVDMSRAFLEICHAQSCGKCVPCRVGLGQLKNLITDVLDGKATIRTLTEIHETAKSIMESADCAIGYEAANMVYKGVIGFKDDYVEHIMYHRCLLQTTDVLDHSNSRSRVSHFVRRMWIFRDILRWCVKEDMRMRSV